MSRKRKKSFLQKIEDVLDDFAMWHKKLIRKVRKWLNLTDYKLLWLSFGEGLIIGILLVILF
tara:strand:- start:1031 stop:1216 length:186 start_codon:yes stop_codon:yes gene_type:complete